MKLARFAGDTDINDAQRARARHNLDLLWEMLDEPA